MAPAARAVRVQQHPPGRGPAPRHAPAAPAPALPRPHRLAGAQRAHPRAGPQRAEVGERGAGAAGVEELEGDAVEGGVALHREVAQVAAHLVAAGLVVAGVLRQQQVGFQLNKKAGFLFEVQKLGKSVLEVSFRHNIQRKPLLIGRILKNQSFAKIFNI